MNDKQASQPLTEDTEINEARAAVESWHDAMPFRLDELDTVLEAFDRLRAENAAVKRQRDGYQKMMDSAVSAGVVIDGERLDALREIDRLKSERGDMLTDLQWYITDMGPEHWQHCDTEPGECYLCDGHVAIRDKWSGAK